MFDADVDQIWDVIIVGGGPAGFFAAIRCAELARQSDKSLRVLIIERARRSLNDFIKTRAKKFLDSSGMVAGGGIEPPTQGFSVLCSTN